MQGAAEKKTFSFPNGEKVDLFYIHVLALAVNRSSDRVRHWEREGKIPHTPFRDSRGNRLYSREHIDVIKAALEKHWKKKYGSVSFTHEFKQEVQRGFDDIYRKYCEKR